MLFECATTTSTPLIVILIGMGGAGKTQLALEYCRRMKDERRFRAIFWLDASSRDTMYSSMETTWGTSTLIKAALKMRRCCTIVHWLVMRRFWDQGTNPHSS